MSRIIIEDIYSFSLYNFTNFTRINFDEENQIEIYIINENYAVIHFMTEEHKISFLNTIRKGTEQIFINKNTIKAYGIISCELRETFPKYSRNYKPLFITAI